MISSTELFNPTHDTWRARRDRRRHRGYSCCMRCGFTWATVDSHITQYTLSRGCFPLCQTCWEGLTIKERVPYYEALIWVWYAQTPDRDPVEAQDDRMIPAVLEGW